MDPKHTALVLIEYQNDFTSEGGTLHGAVKPVMEATNMLANTIDTVKQARALGAMIVYAPITFTDDYHELTPEPYGILKGVVDSKSFRKGTWGAEIVDELKPEAQDIVIEGKRGLDGFASTNLDFILRSRGITNIALGGFLTNCCVESTMRTGYEKGYNVITLRLARHRRGRKKGRRWEERSNFFFSPPPMNHDEFLTELSRAPAVETTSRGYGPSQPTQAIRARPAAPTSRPPPAPARIKTEPDRRTAAAARSVTAVRARAGAGGKPTPPPPSPLPNPPPYKRDAER